MRDSRRRAALDTDYAVEHPVRPAKEGKDPTERFNSRELKRPMAKAGSPWRHYAHNDEAPEAHPIDRPSRAVLAKAKAGGLTHDAGAGRYLGKTVEVFDGFPAGALMFNEPEDSGGFYLHPPLPERARSPRAPRAAALVERPEVVAPSAPPAGGMDAVKDNALLDPFN